MMVGVGLDQGDDTMNKKMILALTLTTTTIAAGTAAWADAGHDSSDQGSILVRNEGGYNARFSVAYNPSGAKDRVTKKSGDHGRSDSTAHHGRSDSTAHVVDLS
jgi:hypothetical protein